MNRFQMPDARFQDSRNLRRLGKAPLRWRGFPLRNTEKHTGGIPTLATPKSTWELISGKHGVSNPQRESVHARTKRQIRSLRLSMKTKISARADGFRFPSLALFAACGAIGLLAGCASEPSSVVVSAPPPPPPAVPSATVYSAPGTPATVVTQPTAVAVPSPVGGSSIVVMQAPPTAQQEVPTPRPSSSHAWVAGYWTWRNNQYQWMAGHWEVPPRTGAVWTPPRWQPEGTSWRFYEGYWN